MKKNNLFKVLGITLLGYILLSWLVPIVIGIFGWKTDAAFQIGVTKMGTALLETFTGFGNILVFILLVGGFYAVLDSTGVYKKTLEKMVEKFKGNEKIVLLVVMILMAIISSLTGLELGLFVLFPFLISLLLLMGFDKLIALSATFGATIIGMYGSTFAGSFYGVLDQMLQTKPMDNILAKTILFVLGLALLIIFVLLYMKSKKMFIVKNNTKKIASKKVSKKSTAKKVVKKSESKKTEIKKEKIIDSNDKPIWPLLVILGLVFLIFILGTTMWTSFFGSNWFSTAHDAIAKWEIGGFAIVDKLFGGLNALGTWSDPTRFQAYSVVLMFANAILLLVYKIKLSDGFDAFVKGVKEYVVPALLTLLAYSLFVLVFYNPTITVITTWIAGLAKSFNVAVVGAYSLISSVFYPDFYYYSYYVAYTFAQTIKDTSMYSVISIMFTNLYSLIMLIAPTSVLLLASLSITEVKYTEWIKFIWKLALSLLVVSFIVFTVLVLA